MRRPGREDPIGTSGIFLSFNFNYGYCNRFTVVFYISGPASVRIIFMLTMTFSSPR